MELPTFQDIVKAKSLTEQERHRDVLRLVEWNGRENGVKLIGNPYIQSYMTEHMGQTRFEGKPSLREVMENDDLRMKLWKQTNTKERLEINMPQAYSRRSPVCFLKPSVAKFIYTKFGATKVLDFTAGWGGRMLGAYASGIEYIGIDTNTSLRPAYDRMMAELPQWTAGKAQMIWEDCTKVDFATLDYDLVFTSPPYHNKEVYEHMTPFESRDAFYRKFLIPMIHKSLKHIKNNGWVCININPEFYAELMSYGFRPCDRVEEFQQSTTKKKDGTTKMEQVYCWCNSPPSVLSRPPPPTSVCTDPVADGDCMRCRELEAEVRRLKEAMKKLLE